MKIVVAPDSFKGSLTASKVADCIEKGIKKFDTNIIVKKIPIADGGEGTVDALVMATKGEIIKKKVTGPLGYEIDSYFGILGNTKTAVIEMAAAAGLNLVPEDKRNPLNTTTYGVGELIKAAIDYGCNKIILGLGGSATNDGGIGMAEALGVKFYDKNGKKLNPIGKSLMEINYIDKSNMDTRLNNIEIVAACDVNNPLYGFEGAAYVYAPQKGATQEIVEFLDKGLKNYADQIKRQFSIDISNIPGSGAAGGLGGGLIAFLNAKLKSGINIVMEHCNFENEIKDADLLITGEGKTDVQTAYGKAIIGVASIASKYNVPVICLSGALGEGYEKIYEFGITAAFSDINNAMTLKTAMENTETMLIQTSYSLIRLIAKIKNIF